MTFEERYSWTMDEHERLKRKVALSKWFTRAILVAVLGAMLVGGESQQRIGASRAFSAAGDVTSVEPGGDEMDKGHWWDWWVDAFRRMMAKPEPSKWRNAPRA